MGHIKEPKGINLVVDPTPLSADDRRMISEIIANYKATGRKIYNAPTTKSLKRKAVKLAETI